MSSDIAVQWYRHKLWASDRYCSEIAVLTPERFTQDTWSSFPSIRDTVVHMFSADGRWLDRFNGRPPRAKLEPGGYPYLEDIRAKWREIEESQLAFVEQLGDTALSGKITMPAEDGRPEQSVPAWPVLFHVAHHAGYHRGQLATMLRQLGHKPPVTDFLDYIDSANP
jgi:uncharacterized damage-inducible protein DinB